MKKKNLIWLIPLLVLILAAAGYAGLRILRHEEAQKAESQALNERIDALTADLHNLSAEIEDLDTQLWELTVRINNEKEYAGLFPEEEGNYNWLAIGNSITLIREWGRGICSTRPDNDYFGLVKAHLEEKYPKVTAFRYNFSLWEESPALREHLLCLIEAFLTPSLDLVTIQLGENAADADTATYQADLVTLIRYIQGRCPQARIILIDDFWNQGNGDIRKAAAAEAGIRFADLHGIQGIAEYQSKAGTEYLREDGSTGKVLKTEETHPGDAGMEAIADAVKEQLGEP